MSRSLRVASRWLLLILFSSTCLTAMQKTYAEDSATIDQKPEKRRIDVSDGRNVELRVGDSTISYGNKRTRPMDYTSDIYASLLGDGSFSEIEAAASTALLQQTLMSDGQPLLAAIYGGLSSCLTIGCGMAPHATMFSFKKERLEEWRARHPDSVVAEVALASWHVEYAMSVSMMTPPQILGEEERSVFNTALAQAERAVNECSERCRQNPAWHAAQLALGLMQHWPRERFLDSYQRAVSNYPDYLPLHLMAAAYFSPRWYGSNEALHEFIMNASRRAGNKGDVLYARLYWAEQNRWMFMEGFVEWPRMKLGLQGIHDVHSEPWITNHFARFACMAGDPETVATLAEEIGTTPVPEVWDGRVEYYEGCSGWASAWMAESRLRKEKS